MGLRGTNTPKGHNDRPAPVRFPIDPVPTLIHGPLRGQSGCLTTRLHTAMSDDFIVTAYVVLDETLRALGHRSHALA